MGIDDQVDGNQFDTESLQEDLQTEADVTAKNAAAIAAIYGLASQHDLSLEETLLKGLEICVECFAMPLALITRFDDTTCQFEYVLGEPQASVEQRGTEMGFCRGIWADGESIYHEDVGEAQAGSAPDNFLYRQGSYLGAKISVLDQAYGTLCFSSPDVPPNSFTVADKALTNLAAEWVGNEITTYQIQSDLAAKAEHMRCIVDNVVDGIITFNTSLVIESVNRAVSRVFDYSADDLLGQPIQNLFSTTLSEAVLLEGMNEELANPYREFEGRRSKGEVFPMELAVSEMNIKGERLYTVILRDVTERKRVETLKSQFISTVSHELRTPLTSIRGALGIVLGKEASSLSPKAKKMLETASRNSERLTFLINDILDMEKMKGGEISFDMHVIDIFKVARRAIVENEGYAKSYGVRLQLIAQEKESLHVMGDENRLLQVFANLLSNAVKYSPEKGVVSIDVCLGEDGLICVTVADQGSGIPEAFHSKIFSRFAQADTSDTRQQGGTGLGLAVSRAIIEHHSGHIDFRSELGKGSEFYFYMPRWLDIVRAQSGDITASVLICEDNLDVGYVLSSLLEDHGLVSDMATTGEAAKKLLAEKTYQLMLLDLTLPDTDGISLLRDIRVTPSTSHLPVIVVSANIDSTRDEGGGDGLAVIDWLQKPIDDSRLSMALLHALHGDQEYRILHVEDDLDVVQVVGELVADFGEYVYATSLAQARDYLDEQEFDLVLLDLTLPDGEGVDLLDTLAERVPVVIFSGKDPCAELAGHFDASLTKATVSNEQLMMTIKGVLNRRAVEHG